METHFSEVGINVRKNIQQNIFNGLSAKRCPFYLGINVLVILDCVM